MWGSKAEKHKPPDWTTESFLLQLPVPGLGRAEPVGGVGGREAGPSQGQVLPNLRQELQLRSKVVATTMTNQCHSKLS